MKFDTFSKWAVRIKPIIIRYRYPIVGVIVIALFAFTVFRIDALSTIEADQETYDKGIASIERIEFDEKAIETIRLLRDTGVDINPQLPSNRDNPFQ